MSGRALKGAELHLDLRRYELRRGDRILKLERQPMELLILLVENRGELVTREQIVARLWDGHTFVDTERSVNSAIRKIRRLLNDDADEPRFIETVVGKGYRFTGTISISSRGEDLGTPPLLPQPQVVKKPAEAAISTGEPASSAIGSLSTGAALTSSHGVPPTTEFPTPSEARTQWRTVWLGFIACGFLVALLVGFNIGGLRQRFWGRADSSGIRSIAVLPLENLSRDPEQEYFADGMAEALTTELAQISALKVISRTSTMQYKGTKKSLPQIARELSVDAVVEGAVQRFGDKVEITVQLIHAPSDRHLWAKSYVRGSRDVLELQREVAHAITDEIKAKLTPPEKARLASARSINSDAYEDYLKGRFFLATQSERDVRKGIAYFQQTIQKDPNYALAYAGLAESYISLGQPWVGGLSPNEALQPAKEAATKALEIDDSIGEAHLALARVIQLHDWDWRRVEKEYRRALDLNPNDAMAHNWYGEYLQEMGRNEEAFVQMRQAIALDPLSSGSDSELGYIFYTARQYDQAIRAFQKALELEPDVIEAHIGLGWVYEEKKMYKESIAELEKAVSLSNRHELIVASLGKVLGDVGRKQEARKLLEELEERSKHHYVSPCLIALVQIGLGERDQAIASLEQGYTDRDQWMLYLKVDPHLDDLRSEPRFQDLVRRMGFPQ